MISIHLENLKNDYEKLGNDDQNAAAKKTIAKTKQQQRNK